MTAAPYLLGPKASIILRPDDSITTGEKVPLDAHIGAGTATIEVGARDAIASGLFSPSAVAVVGISGVHQMPRTRQTSAASLPSLNRRLLAAVATGLHNGFPVDATVLDRGLSLASALENYDPRIVAVAALNLGPSGSLEFLLSLPKVIIEVTAARGDRGFDVCIEHRSGTAAVKELSCLGASQVVKIVAAAAR